MRHITTKIANVDGVPVHKARLEFTPNELEYLLEALNGVAVGGDARSSDWMGLFNGLFKAKECIDIIDKAERDYKKRNDL